MLFTVEQQQKKFIHEVNIINSYILKLIHVDSDQNKMQKKFILSVSLFPFLFLVDAISIAYFRN